ncbi:hypothetical protein KBD49_11585 [Myxococcota bacterium]|jgi:phosphomevalonate kinase|nr:hypothetical protein [Myxococcota bacterium]
MTRQTVRAPGKVFLFGEWAVIAGAPAVVMAVDRHVRVRFLPGATGSAPLVQAARRMAEEFLGVPPSSTAWEADSSALFLAGRKIGLGSSAAVAAAAVGSVFAEQGCDLSELPVRWTILRLAREVHRRLQGGRGSGVDVAAAVFGGIRVHRTGITGPEAPPAFALPPGLSVRFLWTGREVSTPDRLEVFEEFRSRQPGAADEAMDRLVVTARALVEPPPGDRQHFLSALEDHADALDRLGSLAGLPMRPADDSPEVRRTRAHGGVLKASGSGGGDLLVAFLPDETLEPWDRDLRSLGFDPFPLPAAREGIHCAEE